MARFLESPASPFGDLIAAARAEGLSRRPADQAIHTAAAPRHLAQLDLHFQTGLAGDSAGSLRSRRSLTLPVSLALHAAAIAAMLVVPLVMSDSLPDPAFSVRAFFVEPQGAAPPPPPPPPPAPRSAMNRAQANTPPPQSSAFIAPIEVPNEVKPDAGIDLGIEGGVAGGVEGGVPGGVVGGVVGGLSDAPPRVEAVRVGGLIKAPRRVKYVEPVYPAFALQARVQGIIIIEATVDANGRVANASVLRGMPMLDEAALEAVKQWVYSPTLLDGIPTPILMTVTVTFQLTPSA